MSYTKRQKLKKSLAGNRKPIVSGLPNQMYKYKYTRTAHYETFIKGDRVHLRKQHQCSWEGCREHLCGHVVSALTDVIHYEYFNFSGKCCPHTKDLYKYYTSLMFIEANYKNMKKGLRILHYFEKKAGFDLTFIKNVKIKDKDTLQDIVYVCGPKEWAQSVPYLSLYLMLIKLIIKHPTLLRETPENFFKRVVNNHSNTYQQLEWYLKKLFEHHPDIINIVIKYYKELNSAINYSEWKGGVETMEIQGINTLTTAANTPNAYFNWSNPHKNFIKVLQGLLETYKGKRCH